MTENFKLIVGLGNPGAKYSGTRHNIGFEVIEQFARDYGFNFQKEKKFHALIAARDIEIQYQKHNRKIIQLAKSTGQADEINSGFAQPPGFEKKITVQNFTKKFKLILAMPQTYMNESGKAVREIVNYYKINYEDLLVVHDDVSLDTGKIKSAFKRGAGGQHGIESIIQEFGTREDFYRLKIGVGPDPGGDQRANYVLSKFPQEQKELVEKIIQDAVNQVSLWLTGDDVQQVKEFSLELV